MAMKIYKWHGNTYQIADEDLDRYPGAVPVEPKKEKKAEKAPSNKSRKAADK